MSKPEKAPTSGWLFPALVGAAVAATYVVREICRGYYERQAVATEHLLIERKHGCPFGGDYP